MFLFLIPVLFLGMPIALAGPFEGPQIAVDSLSHDFGKIPDRHSVTHIFVIENRGSEKLLISKVEAEKNCRISKIFRDVSIEPGGKLDLDVIFNPKNLSKYHERKILIHSNDPKRPVLTLTIKAVVQLDYRFKTPFLTYRNLDYGQKICRSVQVESFMSTSLELMNLIPSHEFVSGIFRRDGKTGLYFLDVEVDTSLLPRDKSRYAATIEFDTNSQINPKGSYTILISVKIDIEPRPGKIETRNMEFDRLYGQRIELINNMTMSFELTGVRFSNSALELNKWTIAGNDVLLEYEINKGVRHESIEGQFELDLKMDYPTKVQVPFKGYLSEQTVAALGLTKKKESTLHMPKSPENDEKLLSVDLSTCPLIEVDRMLHDFGRVNQGDELETFFEIWNKGHSDLVIERIHSGCGCVVVNDLIGKKIPPGESENLAVRLLTKNRSLELSKSISIKTNDPTNAQGKKVLIKAYIHVDYRVNDSMLRFIDVREGTTYSKRVAVQSYMEEPLVLSDFESSVDFVQCAFGKVQKEGSYFVDVTVDTTTQQVEDERLHGQITYKSNSPQLPKGTMYFYMDMIKDIKANPRKILLYRYNQVQKEEIDVTLTNVLNKNFAIKKVDLDLDFVDVEIKESLGTTAKLLCRLNEKAGKGRFSSNIFVYFDYEGQDKLEIPFQVIIMN